MDTSNVAPPPIKITTPTTVITPNDASTKVHFQLNPSKSKNVPVHIRKSREDVSFPFSAQDDEQYSHSIADAAAAETARRKEEGTSLIIPLSDSTSRFHRHGTASSTQHSIIPESNDTNSNSNNQQCVDWDVIQAISREAMKDPSIEGHDAAQRNVLTIPTPSNLDDTEKILFQRDMAQRADELTVDSSAYIHVPIAEYGAAMLRGMGWKDEQQNQDTYKSKSDFMQPRHARLGLGALPKKMGKEEENRNELDDRPFRRGHADLETVQQQVQEKELQRKRMEIQSSIQVGSIVWVYWEDVEREKDRIPIQCWSGKRRIRARVEKTSGVPGLNRVMVQWEGGPNQPFSIDKKKLHLSSIDEVDRKPFMGIVSSSDQDFHTEDVESHAKKRRHQELDASPRDRKDKKREEYHSRDERHYSADHKEERHSSKDHNRSSSQQVSNHGPENKLWLMPHIRIRVIDEKVKQGKFFKQKGVVLDVIRGGSEAVIRMDNGVLLENIPQKYLATALPKVGGRAIVLHGPLRLSQGTLLERRADRDRGVIQLDSDLTVKSFPLDDIAEYCGHNDL